MDSLLVSQPSVCISSCFCLFFNNCLKHLSFKPHNMIIVFQFQNGKCNMGDTKNLKLRSGESCERSHVKTEKTVMHCKRDQSQSAALSGYKSLPEINLLQAQVPSQKNTRVLKMRSPQPGCYGHVIDEIQLVCQTEVSFVCLLCFL